MKNYRISSHALYEMERRDIEQDLVDTFVSNPDQKVLELDDIVCYQSKIIMNNKIYLLRVMVNENSVPHVVVTVYKTSKIEKYWRKT